MGAACAAPDMAAKIMPATATASTVRDMASSCSIRLLIAKAKIRFHKYRLRKAQKFEEKPVRAYNVSIQPPEETLCKIPFEKQPCQNQAAASWPDVSAG